MTEILDTSHDEDGDITQFLILEDGQPETKIASPENMLLYDPKDDLPFDGGMKEFLSGNSALRLSTSPEIVVGQSSDDYSYVLSVDGDVVETTPRQAEEFLQGVYDAVASNDSDQLTDLHDDILSNQVRRRVVNALFQTFDERDRISIVSNGWLVDEFYLVDWNASMYANNDDPDEADYVRSGSDVVKKDKTYEFVRLRGDLGQVTGTSVTIDGEDYVLTEREMLFLAKVTWLLNRRHYHPDTPFWEYADQWASLETDEPNLDKFDI